MFDAGLFQGEVKRMNKGIYVCTLCGYSHEGYNFDVIYDDGDWETMTAQEVDALRIGPGVWRSGTRGSSYKRLLDRASATGNSRSDVGPSKRQRVSVTGMSLSSEGDSDEDDHSGTYNDDAGDDASTLAQARRDVSALETNIAAAMIENRGSDAANLHNEAGAILMGVGEYSAALSHFQKEASLWKGEMEDAKQCAALRLVAAMLCELGKMEANDFAIRALSMAEALRDDVEIERCCVTLGNIACKSDDPATATEFRRRSLSLARKIGDREMKCASLNNWGDLHLELGEQCSKSGEDDTERHLTIAMNSFTEMKSLAEAVGDKENFALASCGMGRCLLALNDPERALSEFSTDQSICQDLQQYKREAQSFTWLSKAHFHMGNLVEAKRAAEESMRLSSKFGFQALRSAAAENVETIEAQLRTHRTMSKLERQIEEFRRHSDVRGVARALKSLIELCVEEEMWDKGRQHSESLLSLVKDESRGHHEHDLEWTVRHAWALEMLSLCNLENGFLVASIEYARKSFKFFLVDLKDDVSAARVSLLLGRSLFYQGAKLFALILN